MLWKVFEMSRSGKSLPTLQHTHWQSNHGQYRMIGQSQARVQFFQAKEPPPSLKEGGKNAKYDLF